MLLSPMRSIETEAALPLDTSQRAGLEVFGRVGNCDQARPAMVFELFVRALLTDLSPSGGFEGLDDVSARHV